MKLKTGLKKVSGYYSTECHTNYKLHKTNQRLRISEKDITPTDKCNHIGEKKCMLRSATLIYHTKPVVYFTVDERRDALNLAGSLEIHTMKVRDSQIPGKFGLSGRLK
jgi:hypothetical protein